MWRGGPESVGQCLQASKPPAPARLGTAPASLLDSAMLESLLEAPRFERAHETHAHWELGEVRPWVSHTWQIPPVACCDLPVPRAARPKRYVSAMAGTAHLQRCALRCAFKRRHQSPDRCGCPTAPHRQRELCASETYVPTRGLTIN